MDEKLLSCPFCGGDAEVLQIGNEVTKKRGFEVKCRTWGCATVKRALVIHHPLEMAKGFTIAAWNRRALAGTAAAGPSEGGGGDSSSVAESTDAPACGAAADGLRKSEWVVLLTEVRDACLYAEDDGQIGVTSEPCIDGDLFARICTAIKSTEASSPQSEAPALPVLTDSPCKSEGGAS